MERVAAPYYATVYRIFLECQFGRGASTQPTYYAEQQYTTICTD